MSTESKGPKFRGIYLFVKDLRQSVSFYELLGMDVETVGDAFARSAWGDLVLEFGTAELTLSYDPNWAEPGLPGNCTISLEFDSDSTVDEVYDLAVNAGHASQLPPCTPPWQARFAILIDPDGNYVGLHGPRDLAADRENE